VIKYVLGIHSRKNTHRRSPEKSLSEKILEDLMIFLLSLPYSFSIPFLNTIVYLQFGRFLKYGHNSMTQEQRLRFIKEIQKAH
jgi:hypothetical protein